MGFPGGAVGKNPPATLETQARAPVGEDPRVPQHSRRWDTAAAAGSRRAHAPQEKSPQAAAPARCNQRKPARSSEDAAQPTVNRDETNDKLEEERKLLILEECYFINMEYIIRTSPMYKMWIQAYPCWNSSRPESKALHFSFIHNTASCLTPNQNKPHTPPTKATNY